MKNSNNLNILQNLQSTNYKMKQEIKELKYEKNQQQIDNKNLQQVRIFIFNLL